MAEDAIFSPITLPSGVVLSNRLVKVALYEHLAKLFGGPPNSYHFQVYKRWSQHDWAMILTGNVQVMPDHICLGRDLVAPSGFSDTELRPFKELADAIHGQREHRPKAILQLSHAGRQSPNFIGGRPPFVAPLAPSSIRLGSTLKEKGWLSGLIHQAMFGIPRTMSLADIDQVVDAFVRGARVASLANFDGVQLHVAHGYLLAQFISPKSNLRTDEYSCAPANTLRLLNRIVVGIRSTVPPDFILGLKINSADYADVSAAGEASSALDHVRTIASWGLVDFLEISGGDYEKPDFVATAASASSRQALFAEFSQEALRVTQDMPHPPLILLTGGLTTPAQLHRALSNNHTHLLGLGRSAILRPDLPTLLKDGPSDPNALFAPLPDLGVHGWWATLLSGLPQIKLIGAGVAMAWYTVELRRLGKSGAQIGADYRIGAMGSLFWMWAWAGPEPLSLVPVFLASVPVLAVAWYLLQVITRTAV
ncbi:hypothetical protein FB45DRAFT_910774 [Roridomyces roridus]|uniref:NADH:flavin oxidoreductase/NADH oxidase N-terminal domain-containing protein n=1 Tax=Roridomyces roridus TaxID=1738132 RepID=A0AAD7BZY4_9AGAR|nr:hypothetical protein FB45DRAFT_910774 [Roridomyces roridus]